MTAKEKAKDLFDRFFDHAHGDFDENKGFDLTSLKVNTIKCALIAVDEILTAQDTVYGDDSLDHNGHIFNRYWLEVKDEINKL